MGWGLLNDALKTAWILDSTIENSILFPRLFPRFGFATPPFPAFLMAHAGAVDGDRNGFKNLKKP